MTNDNKIDLIEILALFWHKIGWIILFTLIVIISAGAYCFLTPKTYRAQSLIIPIGKGNDVRSATLSQLGGLIPNEEFNEALAGERLITALRSDIVLDGVLDRFHLMTSEDSRVRARTRLGNILQTNINNKSGVITVAMIDEDPQKASDMTNCFVELLQERMQEIAVNETIRQRAFFEEQAREAFDTLSKAEDELARYQEESDIAMVESMQNRLLAAIAQRQADIAAKEVEISGLMTYARKDNPKLRQARSELEAMRADLARLEEQRKQQELTGQENQPYSSVSQAPQLNLEYQRRLRNVKFASTMYELRLRWVEAAKLGEGGEMIRVQVLNPATPPDAKYQPKTTRVLVFSAIGGFFGGIFLVMMWYFIKDAIEVHNQRKEEE